MDKVIDLKLGAYHGSLETKAFYVERMKKHRAADEIIQGLYWDGSNGCAVGCALEIDPDEIEESIHQRYERVLGIPLVLARLQDGIFEGLSKEDAKDFPVRFLEAIRPGADLSSVTDKFLLWLLIDPEHGVIHFADEQAKVSIEAIAALYRRKIAGELLSDDAWQSAAYAARAAADAAYAAARAADAARAAAYAAAHAAYAAAHAADAAHAAAYAAAYAARAAARAARKIQADYLISLLAAC